MVSIDSPAGYPHDGATVSAPVFKRIAEQVLAYLDVPRDVPLTPQMVQAAYKRKDAEEDNSLDDLTPVDFSATPEPADDTPQSAPSKEPIAKSHEVMVAVEEGGDIEVPDFHGKTMREVTETCMQLGLDPVLVGSRLATEQVPAAGTKVRRGTKVTVEFGDAPVHAGKSR